MFPAVVSTKRQQILTWLNIDFHSAGVFLLWAGFVFVVEIAVVALFLNGQLATVWAILIHLSVVGLLAAQAWILKRMDRPLRKTALLTISTAVLGPLGVAGSVGCAVLHWKFQRHSTTFNDWYFSLFPEKEWNATRHLLEKIKDGRENTAKLEAIQSLSNVLSCGDHTQKQRVIALLARDFRPEFAPVLKAALVDSDTRVQAATAVSKIEHAITEQWFVLRKKVDQAVDDFAANFALARHLDRYAYLGLWDDEQTQDIQELALNSYRRCLELKPGDEAVLNALGRMLVRRGEIEEAVKLLEPVIDNKASSSLLYWYSECLFRLGHFDQLRRLSTTRKMSLAHNEKLPEKLKDVMEFWTGESHAG